MIQDNSDRPSNQPNQNPPNQILQDERELLLDHNYDGIQELDHPLPRWWVWLFYATMIFAGLYTAYYMAGPGPTLREELDVALKKIEALKPQPAPGGGDGNSDGLGDGVLAALLTQPEHVNAGGTVFTGKCAACHGDKGQGLIGPNLTDDHWLHGTGKLSEIAAVIRDGVPDKGMPPWGPILTPDELKDVTVFIRSIHGTNPPGAKEPQGTLHALQ